MEIRLRNMSANPAKEIEVVQASILCVFCNSLAARKFKGYGVCEYCRNDLKKWKEHD